MTNLFWIDLSYLAAAVFFIAGLKQLSAVKTARQGNWISALGMLLAAGITVYLPEVHNYLWIGIIALVGTLIGAVTAYRVRMTAMPQMVALFNGFGGLASALVAWAEWLQHGSVLHPFPFTALVLGAFIGSVTFTGSMIAWGKLQGVVNQQPVTYPLQKSLNLLLTLSILGAGYCLLQHPNLGSVLAYILIVSSVLGILLVLPIGGADMPVVISLLNSYSGLAAAMTGFILMNKALIVSGALVGTNGIFLTQIMCRAMNRSLTNVMFGGFGKIKKGAVGAADTGYASVKSCSAEEAAMILEGAQSVILVPGYGLAVSRAQHALKELAQILESRGAVVKYAIHPVAGRMPGHMNVLLAEADVPYDKLYEMDQINNEFEQTDVALVVGANDVTNPAARNEPGSPIYGMPILNVDKARTSIVIKRSLSPGFAGIKNPLFESEKSILLFQDAKAALEGISKELKTL